MEYDEFEIGKDFYTATGKWRCTDKGTLTIVAIFISKVTVSGKRTSPHKILNTEQATKEGWFNGPPYAIAEHVFDENDFEGCSLDPQD